MTINEVHIHKFGRHENLTIHFTEGLNLITGDNECGKSTLFAFIRASLYGLDGRASENYRKKYTPWHSTDAGSHESVKFGGELIFTQNGVRYRVVSVFTHSKRTDITTLYNDTSGEIINIPDGATVTIRRFSKNPMTIEKLLEYKSITPEVADFLERASRK